MNNSKPYSVRLSTPKEKAEEMYGEEGKDWLYDENYKLSDALSSFTFWNWGMMGARGLRQEFKKLAEDFCENGVPDAVAIRVSWQEAAQIFTEVQALLKAQDK